MTDFDVGAEVNAKEFHVYVGANDADGVYAVGTEEWKILQNARVSMSHPIFREPQVEWLHLQVLQTIIFQVP